MDEMAPKRKVDESPKEKPSKISSPLLCFGGLSAIKEGTNPDLTRENLGPVKRARVVTSPSIATSTIAAAKKPKQPVKKPRVAALPARQTSRATATVSHPSQIFNTQKQVSALQASKDKTNVTSTTGGAVPKTTSKRPPWDFKGKNEDLELQVQSLRAQLQMRNTELVAAKASLQNTVESSAIWKNQKEQADQRILLHEQHLREERKAVQDLVADVSKSHSDIRNLETQLGVIKERAKTFEAVTKTQTHEIVRLKCEADLKKNELQTKDLIILDQSAQLLQTNASNRVLQAKVETQEALLNKNETERRRLHNLVQELKGNIRVFCRIRPALRQETNVPLLDLKFSEESDSVCIQNPLSNEASNSSISSKNYQPPKYIFKFDKVFEPTASQETVFEEISQLVQSVLDGYHVCIFAYGQTGSGKTYTMEGPPEITDFVRDSCNTKLGMIPRTVRQIFSTIESLKDRGWTYNLAVSIMEIYNEVIRDLLGVDASGSSKISSQKGMDAAIASSTTCPVSTQPEVYKLLEKARKNRAVAATKDNAYSSRSHSIFRMTLSGKNNQTEETCLGTLSLVDLAGSERVKELAKDVQRSRETKNINQSLSNLGNVILALADKKKTEHVPYRNSKLTHLLQNSLGGNSKTLMFINLSPKEEHFKESLNTLRFACTVNQCNIGTATKVPKK